MFTDIAITPMYVTDLDVALAFYVEKLGFEVHTDADMGFMRWLTVTVPGRPDREVLLALIAPPGFDPEAVKLATELVERGSGPWMILHTTDCRAAFEKLTALGVEIIEEPTERFYGIDMAVRDPFGNQIRISQPAAPGFEVPAPTGS